MALAIYVRGRKKRKKNEKWDWRKNQSKNTFQMTRHKQNNSLVCPKCLFLLYSIYSPTTYSFHIFMTLKYFVKNKVIFIVSLEEKKIIVLMSIRYWCKYSTGQILLRFHCYSGNPSKFAIKCSTCKLFWKFQKTLICRSLVDYK